MEFGRWLVFLLLNIAIFLGWFGVLNRQAHTVATRLIIAFTLSIAQVISSIFLLGLPWARLTALNLVLLNGGFSGALLAMTASRRQSLIAFADLGRAARDLIVTTRGGPVPKILAVLTAVVIVWTIFIAIIYPPVEWDSLMYHLPAVGHYMQQESITDPPLPMEAYSEQGIDGSVWVNAFPKNIELLFLWATIIPGNDTVVDLVEMIFALIGMVAVYVLATRLGVAPEWAVPAGMLFFLTPIVMAQSRSGLIDLSISALILVSLALLFPGNSQRRPTEVVVAGIAMGIVVGAKWSGLLFLPVVWAMLIGQRVCWNYRDQLPKLRQAVNESALFIGPALIFGSYWYVKNWYLYGNPLWPFRISFLGLQIFSGVLAESVVRGRIFPSQLQGMNMLQMLWTSWRELIIYGYDHDMKLGGLGPFWFILGLPAIFYTLLWMSRRREWAQVLILLAAAAMLVLHPDNWWTRYTMFIAGLGAIAYAFIRSAGTRPEVARLLDIMLIVMVIYSTVAGLTAGYYQPAKIGALLAKPANLRTSAGVRPEIFSRAFDYISGETAVEPANIAYGSGLDFTYPLWGSALRNRVYYLRPNRLSSWVEKLQEKQVKYLLIKKDGPEQVFVDASPLFRRVYFDRRLGYEVYIFRGI